MKRYAVQIKMKMSRPTIQHHGKEMLRLKCLQALDTIVQLCHYCPGDILNKPIY